MPNRLLHGIYVKLMTKLLSDEGAEQAKKEQEEDIFREMIENA